MQQTRRVFEMVIAVVGALFSVALYSQPKTQEDADRDASGAVTLSTTVTGNQEQPKVLYIVPWQAAQDEQILYEPLNSQTNKIFNHIERSEHLRELEFVSGLRGKVRH